MLIFGIRDEHKEKSDFYSTYLPKPNDTLKPDFALSKDKKTIMWPSWAKGYRAQYEQIPNSWYDLPGEPVLYGDRYMQDISTDNKAGIFKLVR